VRQMIEPTKREKECIDALKKLARKWPKTIWLFSGSGTLCVMRTGENGEQITTSGGGMDQDFVLDTIRGIPNDGGDW